MIDLHYLLQLTRQTRQAQLEQARLEAEVRKARRHADRSVRPARKREPALREETCA